MHLIDLVPECVSGKLLSRTSFFPSLLAYLNEQKNVHHLSSFQGVSEAVMNQHWLSLLLMLLCMRMPQRSSSSWFGYHRESTLFIYSLCLTLQLSVQSELWGENEALAAPKKESHNSFATISHDWNQLGSHFSSTLKIFAISFSFELQMNSRPQCQCRSQRKRHKSPFSLQRRPTTISSFTTLHTTAEFICALHLIEQQVINMQKGN